MLRGRISRARCSGNERPLVKGYAFRLIAGLLVGCAMAASSPPNVQRGALTQNVRERALLHARPVAAIVTFEIDARHAATAVADFSQLRKAACSQPGVVMFLVGRSANNPSQFVLVEAYRDQQSLEAFRRSAPFVRYASAGIHAIAQAHQAQSIIPLTPVRGSAASCR